MRCRVSDLIDTYKPLYACLTDEDLRNFNCLASFESHLSLAGGSDIA